MLILKTWLQYLTDLDFFGLFMKIIRSIFLALDGIIYAIISYCYEVFNFISEIRVFENEDMVNLANRIYILIGVVSLFLVAYTLLNAIINPENATKDKNKSFAGIVKNIILAIIGIAIVPTIFDYAYEFQSRVLCNNVIQKFFLENNITEDDDARAKMGAQMSLYLFKSFYYIKGSEDDTSLDENANSNWETMAQSIVSDNDDSYNLSMAFSDIELGNRSISEALGDFDDSIDSGKLGYLFLISTLAGAFCAYVILGFVIDMGVRAVKLAYLQLIAPLPILSLILPNQKKVFDNWLKKTSSCFIEVFTRIIAMSFAFYAIKYLRPWIFNDMSTVSCGRTVGAVTKLLAQAAFIVGVFAFLKQLPKFIKDLLPGFDSAGFKLGFGNAFAEAGGFQALGMAEGAVKGGIRNAAVVGRDSINKYQNAPGRWSKLRSALSGVGRTASAFATGGVASGVNAYKNSKDIKRFSDLKSASNKAAEQVTTKTSEKIDKNNADYQEFSNRMESYENGATNRIDAIKNRMKGELLYGTEEAGKKISSFIMTDESKFKSAQTMDNIKSKIDSLKSTADAISSSKQKDVEKMYELEVSNIEEEYKTQMRTATTNAQRQAIQSATSAKLTSARERMETSKRNIQSDVLMGTNSQIVAMREELAELIKNNQDAIRAAMQTGNHIIRNATTGKYEAAIINNRRDDYGARVLDANFIENIKNGTAFSDAHQPNNTGGYDNKKSVILELGTNLGTTSGKIKAEIEDQKKEEKK